MRTFIDEKHLEKKSQFFDTYVQIIPLEYTGALKKIILPRSLKKKSVFTNF